MSDTEELWQAYNEQGEPIAGKGLTKPQARSGILHGAAHLWIWRKRAGKIEILLQKQAANKATWPSFLDISVAGHIDPGEDPLTSALREADEEIGFAPAAAEVRLLFVHHARLHDDISGADENEFQWVYGLELTKDAAFCSRINPPKRCSG
jgi:isopentenyldiphosphate isomerase